MPDERQLSIKIATVADTSGISDTTKSLAQLNEEAKKQVAQSSELSDSTQKYIKKLADAENEEKKAVASKGEIRRGLREIGAELPVLGEVGRIAVDPLIGGFVLFASEISAALDGIKELGDRSTPEFARLTEAVESGKQAIEEADLATKQYERSLIRLAQAKQTIEESSNLVTSDVNASGNADLTAADATQKKITALLQAQEAAQLITHAQYIAKKLELDEDYAKHRLEIENRLAAAAVIQKATELYNTRTEATALQNGLKAKEDAAKQTAGKAAFATGRQSTDEENLKATEEKLKELQKEQVELHDKTTGLGRFTTTDPQFILERQKVQNDQETADNMRIADQLRARIKLDKEQKSAAADASAAAKEDLDADRSRLSTDTTRINQLGRELPHDTRQMQQGIADRNANAATESQTRIITAAKDIAAAGSTNATQITSDLAAITKSVTQTHGKLAADIAKLRRDMERNLDAHNTGQSLGTGGH